MSVAFVLSALAIVLGGLLLYFAACLGFLWFLIRLIEAANA